MGMETSQFVEGATIPPVRGGPDANLETVIRIGDLQVDIGNSSVRIGRDYIPLTATEYRILCTLMMQPSAVIRRAALLTAVCEKQTHATSRSLDVHMSRLRTKLRTYGTWIRTVKGVGYRFVPIVASDPPGKSDALLDTVNS